MSFVTKNIICRNCEKKFSARILNGFLSNSVGLDSNPHQPEIYEKAVLCPHCGYVTSKISENVSEEIRETVRSLEYRKILMNERLPNAARRLILDAQLLLLRKDCRNAGYQYLAAFWCVQEHKGNACDLLEKAVKCFSVYLETHADIETAIVLVDCLRQLGKFAESLEAAESLQNYVSDPYLKKILQYEKLLVASEDMRPHSRNEVQA